MSSGPQPIRIGPSSTFQRVIDGSCAVFKGQGLGKDALSRFLSQRFTIPVLSRDQQFTIPVLGSVLHSFLSWDQCFTYSCLGISTSLIPVLGSALPVFSLCKTLLLSESLTVKLPVPVLLGWDLSGDPESEIGLHDAGWAMNQGKQPLFDTSDEFLNRQHWYQNFTRFTWV